MLTLEQEAALMRRSRSLKTLGVKQMLAGAKQPPRYDGAPAKFGCMESGHSEARYRCGSFSKSTTAAPKDGVSVRICAFHAETLASVSG
jgi:hypothetical protein